jgi:hypothetical protein
MPETISTGLQKNRTGKPYGIREFRFCTKGRSAFQFFDLTKQVVRGVQDVAAVLQTQD